MFAVRLGAYSMGATFAFTPSLSLRREWITPEGGLCPPPWCRVVTRPCALRPPRPCSGRTKDFSGVERVISAKSETLAPRRPGVVGLYLRIPMSVKSLYPRLRRCAEQFDRLAAGRQRHDGALGALPLAVAASGALALALAVRGVHRGHLDRKDLLDRNLDLRLVRVRVHQERVHVVVDQSVGLLRDDRGQDDVAGVSDSRHQAETSSVSSAALGVADPM